LVIFCASWCKALRSADNPFRGQSKRATYTPGGKKFDSLLVIPRLFVVHFFPFLVSLFSIF
jgi:hypothetical protein